MLHITYSSLLQLTREGESLEHEILLPVSLPKYTVGLDSCRLTTANSSFPVIFYIVHCYKPPF